MTKSQRKISQGAASDLQFEKSKTKNAKVKEEANNDRDGLLGRVKKVIKKSRRKLSEDKFEKELQRTIAFLESLQSKLIHSSSAVSAKAKQQRPKAVKKAKLKTPSKRENPSTDAVKPSLTTSAKTKS